jgi:alkylated DNA repair dioxygenase AlkB
LLLMRGTTQHCWQHHIPKRANADRRINLTFRTIIN